jgi:hypothetical protein
MKDNSNIYIRLLNQTHDEPTLRCAKGIIKNRASQLQKTARSAIVMHYVNAENNLKKRVKN